ncbi:hypothetical protein NP233_g1750 [Leucocoprinus birnbaumii]|uniref:Uncharacterized protein n=1 Tax=Leucocoprinus birnbaumii TaxID=56174 RepID=A0AAD5YZA6_9AGAR|nr:hypothetical protein NP233_g1750 [Leucocoprinus birnbaumii]
MASLNWLLPLTILITTVINGRYSETLHSTSYNPETYRSEQLAFKPTFQTQASFPAKHAKVMPGGSDQLDFNDLKGAVKRTSTSTHLHPLLRDSISLPLMKLPVEVRLLIIRYCSPVPAERQGPDSMETFLRLLWVSKTVQHEAYVACLPHIPLALWSKKGVRSFQALLSKKPELGCRVRYLWIGTGKLDAEELSWALHIIHCATQLRSLACGEHFLAQAMNRGLLAKTCRRVTLMGVDKDVMYKARGIRQVRLCTGVWSTKERFPDVTTLCFNARRTNVKDERVKMEYEAVERWTKEVESLILVERDSRRASSRGLEVKFKVGRRTGRSEMFSVSLPARWTEWDIWSSDVVGSGVWDICAPT